MTSTASQNRPRYSAQTKSEEGLKALHKTRYILYLSTHIEVYSFARRRGRS